MKTEFAVVRSAYGWDFVEIIKSSANQFKGVDPRYPSRTQTISKSKAVFIGPEKEAHQLFERLISSAALMKDEQGKSVDRKRSRDEDYIARAIDSLKHQQANQ